MDCGKFFSLDLTASCIEQGITVFSYTDIFDCMIIDGDGQTTPRYPIFVSIAPDSVKFILQYCIYSQKSRFVPQLDPTLSQGECKIRHMEEVLIELPLVTSNGLSLASTLKRLSSLIQGLSFLHLISFLKDKVKRK